MKALKKNCGEKKDEKERNDIISKNRTLFQALLCVVTACIRLRSVDGTFNRILCHLSGYLLRNTALDCAFLRGTSRAFCEKCNIYSNDMLFKATCLFLRLTKIFIGSP